MFFCLGGALSIIVIDAALDTSLGISAIVWGMAGLSVVPVVLWTVGVVRGRPEVI